MSAIRSSKENRKKIHKISRKAANGEGVICSVVKSASAGTERDINLSSCKSTAAYEWCRNSDKDLKEFSPIYAANTINTNLVQTKKQNLTKFIQNRNKRDEHMERLALTDTVNERRKALPSVTGEYRLISNHNLINADRIKQNTLPLHRMPELDELATKQAKRMASQQHESHSTIDDLMSKITQSGPCRKVGENVCKGSSVERIHYNMMHNHKCRSSRVNILDRRFSSFGVGVAPDVKGILYVCQLYKG